MSDYGDNLKYKWTPESTTLLVSVWTDKQVQKQLEYAQRPQLIWESVARYMRKKGYAVSAKQCRSRMKQVLVCYREAKRAGTRAGVEQYYDSIDKVLKNKRDESNDVNGVDTVDSTVPVKSPPKDLKTSKNLRMRFNKYSEPIESLIRTEALSPTWHLAHDEEYPDSPESNETVLAQPYRAFSPMRDVATNTLNGRSKLLTKDTRRTLPLDEQPIREARPLNSLPNNRFGEMVYQNAVQNVQNQIIQENMQQRNLLQNQFVQDDGTLALSQEQHYRRNAMSRNNPFFPIDEAIPSKLRIGAQRNDVVNGSNNRALIENTTRMQNQLQQTCPIDHRAMPQEPQRGNYPQNLPINYKHYKEGPSTNFFTDPNVIETRQRSTNYSPDTAINMNEAFCQTNNNERNHNLNDTYDQQQMENDALRAMNATTITNNATFNDDTISIEFLDGSPSPSDNGATGAKSLSGNSDGMPNVPVRKKKVQKLEQLMLNAITSQSEVVNKILAAQDAMVTRFLDLDRDRQNRLENRLDHLMNVVHATVLNKSTEKDTEPDVQGIPTEPLITSLAPPPRPGAVPPKLDLVPPKPCRVPCTSANTNIELVNQNTVQTRPGVVSPLKQPGSIWSKLGPVSQSPFVRAQQQLGLRAMSSNMDSRTQSSAERKIAREMEGLSMDRRALIFETQKFIEIEKHTEEQSENAKIIAKMGQEVAARRKLFEKRGEPNPGIILSAAFLDSERYVSSLNYDFPGLASSSSGGGGAGDDDEELILLAGQVDNYERLRRLNVQSEMPNQPCDTSTPAKASIPENFSNKGEKNGESPRQTIQQLAQLVMKSARWRDATVDKKTINRFAPTLNEALANDLNIPSRRNFLNVAGTNNNNNNNNNNNEEEMTKREGNLDDRRRSYMNEMAERESRSKALGWLQDRYSYDSENQQPVDKDPRDSSKFRPTAPYDGTTVNAPKSYPMGFTMDNIIRDKISPLNERIPLNSDLLVSNTYARRNVGFADLNEPRGIVEKIRPPTYPRQRRKAPLPSRQETQNYYDNNSVKYSSLPAMHRNMIDRYVQDNRGPVLRRQNDKGDDTDDDDEFLDTTASMQPQSRKTSLTSNGTSTGKSGNCVIS